MMSATHSRSEPDTIAQLHTRIQELEAQLQEGALYTHVLLDIAKALNASLNKQVIASNIISAMVSLIAIDKASVLLYQENTQTFEVVGVFDSSTINPRLPVGFDFTTAHKILAQGTIFYEAPHAPSQDWGWVCSLPLENAQHKIGLMNVHAIRQSEISNAQLEFLETVAGHAASALENAALYDLVQRESITDGLTGVYNHRYFQKRLREYVSLGQRKKYQSSFGLLIIDVDYFKLFNDKYGHQFGDLVLKTVVQALSQNLREEDLLARYGGEEFVLLIPGASEKVVHLISEKVRNVVEQTRIANPETKEEVSITVSVGATVWHPADNPSSIITRADAALYQAKRMGRNQSILK
ncbi:MAG: GGDEF domain-containing protein [Desulfitobacteriaceae bacterium]|nr:GGDEF domain-containing protein [Desulfitobacteriaceae bacterium]MDI6877817.1 GGDEF domain-containing protein [Desulfitobacteriaceae bacterium]MDI6912844.1 GGDEF domain-containing protein [Desulfitobacteriaceae bacterium]